MAQQRRMDLMTAPQAVESQRDRLMAECEPAPPGLSAGVQRAYEVGMQLEALFDMLKQAGEVPEDVPLTVFIEQCLPVFRKAAEQSRESPAFRAMLSLRGREFLRRRLN